MAASPGESNAFPRWVRYLGIPLSGFLITLLFIHLGFPYEPLVARAVRSIEQNHGIQIRYVKVSPHIAGVKLRGVVVSRPGAEDIEIRRLLLRPALDLTWFRGQPSIHFNAGMPIGRASGSIVIGEPAGFEATLDGLDLTALPVAQYAAGLNLSGFLSAELEIDHDPEGGWTGVVELAAEEGSVRLPGQPIAIPFDTCEVEISLGPDEDSFLRIDSAELVGPMVSVSASGRIARGSRGPGELEIELQLAATDASLRRVLRSLGVRLNDSGEATARLGGTLANPVLR